MRAVLTALTAPELRDWLVDLYETGTWAPKALNNGLEALVSCVNHAARDGLMHVKAIHGTDCRTARNVLRRYLISTGVQRLGVRGALLRHRS